MADHSFYFAESVKAILESKSRWSQDDFDDVLLKSRHARDIVTMVGPSIEDTLMLMQLDIVALREGVSHVGMARTRHHIATGGVFLSGGESAFSEPVGISTEIVENADEAWLDLLLLLGPGRLVLKEYYDDQPRGRLLFFELGEDALLAFTNALLKLISDRSVVTESVFYMEQYADEVLFTSPYCVVDFPLTRPMPGRVPIWGEWDE